VSQAKDPNSGNNSNMSQSWSSSDGPWPSQRDDSDRWLRAVPSARRRDRAEGSSSGSSDQVTPVRRPEFLDESHRQRLEELILQQQQEIQALQDTVDRVRALRNLAEWSARLAGGGDSDGHVKVSDLTRALDGAFEGSSRSSGLETYPR
jgi:hypothetical protein